MIFRLGGECAGAVTFGPAGAGLPDGDDLYQALSRDQLAKIFRQLPRSPLLAGEDGIQMMSKRFTLFGLETETVAFGVWQQD